MNGERDTVPEDREPDELEPEYEFDYGQAQPNRFAARGGRRVVLLDPDVAEVFTTPEAVNRVLRALIDAMPAGRDR